MGDEDRTDRGRGVRPNWGLGIALGVALGVSFGVALNNIGAGIALGAGLAVAFALAFGGVGKRRHSGTPDEGSEPPEDQPRGPSSST